MFRVLELWDYKNLNYNTLTGKTKPDFSHDICPITNYYFIRQFFSSSKRLTTVWENEHNI